MQLRIRLAMLLPLPPGLAEIQAGAKAEFADQGGLLFIPACGQAVAVEKDVAAFQPAIGLAIKMVAKDGRLGHIAVAPFELLACRSGFGRVRPIGNWICHGKSR